MRATAQRRRLRQSTISTPTRKETWSPDTTAAWVTPDRFMSVYSPSSNKLLSPRVTAMARGAVAWSKATWIPSFSRWAAQAGQQEMGRTAGRSTVGACSQVPSRNTPLAV